MNIECYRELSPFVDHETIFMLANTNGCAAGTNIFKKICRSTFGKQILAGLLADPSSLSAVVAIQVLSFLNKFLQEILLQFTRLIKLVSINLSFVN